MSKTSPLFVSNDLYTHVCSDCINNLMFEMQSRYKDTKLALMIICHYLDLHFSEKLYEQIKDNANFSFGNYAKLLNGVQYKTKNFVNSLMDILAVGFKGSQVLQEEQEVKWKSSDLKNKNYVMQSVGYDCFEDESYSNIDRKFLFNTAADYFTDDVLEDPHKLQRVIAMVKTTLQVESIDKMINSQIKSGLPDYVVIDKLTGVKEKLTRNINSSANENGISAKGSGKTGKGANALTTIMKEMAENGYDDIKINIVDVKLAQAFQSIAKDNAIALFNELNNTSDDFARMVGTQSTIIDELQTQAMTLNESIRLLKIENKLLKSKNGKSDGVS